MILSNVIVGGNNSSKNIVLHQGESLYISYIQLVKIYLLKGDIPQIS